MMYLVLYSALLSAFALLLATKTGGIEWLQVHAPRLLSEMASCNFCLSWWCNVLLCAAFYLFTGDTRALFVPFFATPLTRFLL